MSAVAIDNELVHYEVLGRGRPVILVHGWLGSWRYWISTMQQLSVKFRTYALDLWGFGDSSKFEAADRDRYSLDAQVALLDGFIKQLGIPKAAFIGHGLGAAVVIRYSAQNPDIAPRVVAISPPVQGAWLSEKLVGSAQNAELMSLVPKNLSDTDTLEAEVAKADIYAIIKSAINIRADDPGNGANAFDMRGDIKGLLDGSTQATNNMFMMLHGGQDPLIQLPESETYEQVLAEYELTKHPRFLRIVLDESSHFPMLDEASKFNRLLNEFLGVRTSEELQSLQPKEQWRRRMR